MSDKISKVLWESFLKKQKLDGEIDDKALVKALAQLDKAGERDHEPRIEALGEVIEQGKKAVLSLAKRKKEIEAKLTAKVFNAAKDELNDVIETAEKLLKEARDAQQEAKNEQDEADSPALLTSKMVPLIRELRKGEATFFVLIAVAGKETVVLISRRAISPARGKLLKEQMSNAAGLKFIRGECLWEQNTLTFVVQAQAAGLAKRVKAALLAQTEQRLKVRVRGEDPNDIDDDGEDASATESDAGAGIHSALQQAQPGRSSTVAPAIVYTQTRLVWVATRGKVGNELKKLEAAILAAYRRRASLPIVTQKVRKLDQVLTMFDESLSDALDAALNATDPQEKQRFHDEARELIARYQRFLDSDPLVQQLDANPFVPIAVKSTLTATLATLSSKIV